MEQENFENFINFLISCAHDEVIDEMVIQEETNCLFKHISGTMFEYLYFSLTDDKEYIRTYTEDHTNYLIDHLSDENTGLILKYHKIKNQTIKEFVFRLLLTSYIFTFKKSFKYYFNTRIFDSDHKTNFEKSLIYAEEILLYALKKIERKQKYDCMDGLTFRLFKGYIKNAGHHYFSELRIMNNLVRVPQQFEVLDIHIKTNYKFVDFDALPIEEQRLIVNDFFNELNPTIKKHGDKRVTDYLRSREMRKEPLDYDVDTESAIYKGPREEKIVFKDFDIDKFDDLLLTYFDFFSDPAKKELARFSHFYRKCVKNGRRQYKCPQPYLSNEDKKIFIQIFNELFNLDNFFEMTHLDYNLNL